MLFVRICVHYVGERKKLKTTYLFIILLRDVFCCIGEDEFGMGSPRSLQSYMLQILDVNMAEKGKKIGQ